MSSISDGFCFNEDAQVLYGHINYGNDIGRTDLKITYKTQENRQQTFIFSYDVLSVKLDYHSDLKHIIHDIEEEYRMLSIDFSAGHTTPLPRNYKGKRRTSFGGTYFRK